MVDNEKLYKLYEAMMNVEEFITTKEIKELGFTQQDIANMVEDGTLVRVKRGFYSFGNVTSLFTYGKSLIDSKKRQEGIKVFNKCFELDPSNLYVAYQLFINAVKTKDYDNILKYYDVMYNYDSTNRKYLYYLYILSYIIELPEHYKTVVSNLSYNDMKVEESDEYTTLLNNTIGLVTNFKISYAYKTRSDYHSKHPSSVDDYAEVTLLKEATRVFCGKKDELDKCIIDGEYDIALDIIKEMGSVREFPLLYKYLSILLNDIVRMINFGETHDVIVTDKVRNVFDAIDNYDYELALKINNERNANYVTTKPNVYSVLLERLIAKKKELLHEEVVEEEVTEVIREEVVEPTVSYSELVSELLAGNVDEFNRLLVEYLHSLNAPGYFTFITCLVELSRLRNESYDKPLVVLTQITDGYYEFNKEEYIKLFYESLSSKKYEEAQLYLYILECVSDLSDELIGQMNQVIKLMSAKEVQAVVEETVEEETYDEEVTDVAPVQVEENPKFVPIAKTSKFKKPDKDTIEYKQDEEYVSRKMETLVQERGLIVLKPMDNVRRKRIHNIVQERKDATTFSIGEGEERRIVIRYIGNVYVPLKETIKIADDAYYGKDYETALRAYLDLLGTNSPKTFIYAKLGLTYMKMWQIDKAIQYLTIATDLSKVSGEKFDFSELIASLDGTIDFSEKKPKVHMKLSEFEAHDDNFGIDRLDEMLVHKEVNDLSYESACEELGFTYEEYLLSLLLLAKRNYTSGNYEAGDKFLKMVEKSGNKSKKVVAKFEEVRKNKKFYKNRNIEQGVSMTLKNSD